MGGRRGEARSQDNKCQKPRNQEKRQIRRQYWKLEGKGSEALYDVTNKSQFLCLTIGNNY